MKKKEEAKGRKKMEGRRRGEKMKKKEETKGRKKWKEGEMRGKQCEAR